MPEGHGAAAPLLQRCDFSLLFTVFSSCFTVFYCIFHSFSLFLTQRRAAPVSTTRSGRLRPTGRIKRECLSRGIGSLVAPTRIGRRSRLSMWTLITLRLQLGRPLLGCCLTLTRRRLVSTVMDFALELMNFVLNMMFLCI